MRIPHQTYRGFTLVELLAVMGIIILLMAAMVPAVSSITSQARFRSGIDLAASAVVAARAVSTLPYNYPRNDYHGAAALFTPSGEIRTIYGMRAPDGLYYTGGAPGGDTRACYKDYPDAMAMQLPTGIRAAGIVRGSKGLKLLGAPFGVRFNKYGMLISGASVNLRTRLIYYDHDLNGAPYHTPARPSDYNPDNWDPEIPGSNVPEIDGKYKMDFPVYETVIGVVVFDNAELHERGFNLEHGIQSGWSQINDDAAEWIFENGKVLLFNRYNGKVVE